MEEGTYDRQEEGISDWDDAWEDIGSIEGTYIHAIVEGTCGSKSCVYMIENWDSSGRDLWFDIQ